ncbi:MAG: MerR family transcriptional regulator, partial [Aquabacterium sp.]|nr:MerR family transcriptional regulator [Aquabacterium sp.]
EQEFTQLKPMKRRGNRRYYQHHEVLLIRRIRDLLYDQGFTISGARNQLGDLLSGSRLAPPAEDPDPGLDDDGLVDDGDGDDAAGDDSSLQLPVPEVLELAPSQLRAELLSIRELLAV